MLFVPILCLGCFVHKTFTLVEIKFHGLADLCLLIYIVHLHVISSAASVKCRQRFTMYFLPINIHSEMLLSQIHLWFQVIFPSSDNN